MSKQFHLGTLISITDGHLVAPNLISDVYDILNYMTNDDLHTFQLGRASNECKPYLLDQFPFLAEIDASGLSPETVWTWLDEQVTQYGEWFDVEPIPMDDHDHIDPIDELHQMGPGDKIITVDLTEQEEPSPYGEINWKVDDDESEVR